MSETGDPEVQNPVVRTWFATFDDDTEGFRHTLHSEVEWFPIEENLSPYVGIDAAMLCREQWLETWDVHEFHIEEVVEARDDVVACVHITAAGRTSGVPVDLRFYAQFKVRDGKIIRIYDHADRDAALQAAGLVKQAAIDWAQRDDG
jgi:ketosteroid isomerase-like protein